MKTERVLWYYNTETGEIVSGYAAQRVAVDWYRAGAEIILYVATPLFEDPVERGRWEY